MDALNGLLLQWHGTDGDDRLWTSYQGGSPSGIWASPQPAGGMSTDAPALLGLGPDAPARAWKGSDASTLQSLFLSSDPNTPIAGPDGPFQSTTRPALGGREGRLVLAWRRSTDGAVVVSQQGPGGWEHESAVGLTSHAPALSPDGQTLVWKGEGDDVRMFISQLTGAGWSFQQQLLPAGGAMLTSNAPALSAGLQGGRSLTLAWKGVLPGDDTIYWSQSPGEGWGQVLPTVPVAGGINTSHGPALALWEGGLVLAWKGVNGDVQLWWSAYDASLARWQTPMPVHAGANSNAGPALIGQVIHYL